MDLEQERVESRGGPAIMAKRVDERRPDPDPVAHPTLVVLHEPAGASAEAMRGLYYGLRRSMGGAPLGVLAVCSAARGEGRSTIASNLALVAARETGQPTALVDGDLRAPGIARLFGLDGELGLSDVLSNRADLDAVIYEHTSSGLSIVPGGRPDPEPARRFTSPRFARFLAQVRHRYNEVIIDLPPLACVDARIVAPQCTGAVMVIRSGRTDAALVREALSALDGVKVLGAMLNDVSEMEAPSLRAARRALPGRR
jgi:capsular exopolysaccharide synthesis family protein